MNPFTNQLEFISLDPRSQCPGGIGFGYQLTPELAFQQHEALLPVNLLDGKTILDLGSCLGASGAWCLSNGAKHYTGVEIQKEFFVKSKKCLQKYYSSEIWEISNSSVENFLKNNKNKYDIIFAGGVLHGLDDVVGSLVALTNFTDFIVVESMHKTIFHSNFISDQAKQFLSQDSAIVNYLENEPYIAVGDAGMLIPGMKSVLYNGFIPSMGALKRIFESLDYSCDETPNAILKAQLPTSYSPVGRFGLHFYRKNQMQAKGFGFAEVVKKPENILREFDWLLASGKSN